MLSMLCMVYITQGKFVRMTRYDPRLKTLDGAPEEQALKVFLEAGGLPEDRRPEAEGISVEDLEENQGEEENAEPRFDLKVEILKLKEDCALIRQDTAMLRFEMSEALILLKDFLAKS